MATLLISCEIFRPELELLAGEGIELPETVFLEAQLHNIPEKLRGTVQDVIDEFEDTHSEASTIFLSYGLCGRGMCGVHSRRATLVVPRIHDCISMLLGQEHNKEHAVTREGAIYWSSPGYLESFQINLHLHYDIRLAQFEEKFGKAKALRMMKAEQAIYRNYHCLGYISWPEMKGRYEETAREVAETVGIPYTEYAGNSSFLRELIAGGHNNQRFLHIDPGYTMDMDIDGTIISVPLADQNIQ